METDATAARARVDELPVTPAVTAAIRAEKWTGLREMFKRLALVALVCVVLVLLGGDEVRWVLGFGAALVLLFLPYYFWQSARMERAPTYRRFTGPVSLATGVGHRLTLGDETRTLSSIQGKALEKAGLTDPAERTVLYAPVTGGALILEVTAPDGTVLYRYPDYEPEDAVRDERMPHAA
jgi:hypothetical protein